MPGQQFSFAVVFITLGAFFGWFLHAIYDDFNLQTLAENKQSEVLSSAAVTIPVTSQIKPAVISDYESSREYFTALLRNHQYDLSLQWYKAAELDKPSLLFPELMHYINMQLTNKNKQVFELLNIFLGEFYDNSRLLLQQAEAFSVFNNIDAALNSFILARNYAVDNDSYIAVELALHEFSFMVFKQYQEETNWQQSIIFFKKLIAIEPQFAFYHLALAESYLNTDNTEQAQMHLQGITEDQLYGPEAEQMLEKIFSGESTNAIKLEQNNGHYIVSIILADVYRVKLMLDTGASYSSLSSTMIAQLVQDGQAVKTGRKIIYTAGGKVTADLYQLNKITLGDYVINDIIVVELDLESAVENNGAFDGLLGINILNQFDFSIDQKTKYLLLSPKKT